MNRTATCRRKGVIAHALLLFAVVIGTSQSSSGAGAAALVQIPDLIIDLNIPEIDAAVIGDTLPLQALHVYRDGHVEKATRRLQWKSSNKNVASVDDEGVVHFSTSQGTTFLSVSDGRLQDRLELTLRQQGKPRVTVVKQKGERYRIIRKLIARMTLEEKIGQMIMADFRRVNGKAVTRLLPEVEAAIKRYQLGGVILFRENIENTEQTINLVHAYQQAAQKYGMLIALDQEGGIVSRLRQGTDLPGNMALGAARSGELAWKAGDVIGSELSSLGINTDFAPDLDVNNNPNNPVIGVRSFGEDPRLVGDLGVAFAAGLQHNGIVSTAKHFPGHGDTAVDSHLGLPQVTHGRERLARVELYPFKQAITAGVDAIMTAHITFPQIDRSTVFSKKDGSAIHLPATLSPRIVTGLLREELGFDGVIFTDAMNMQAIADHFGAADAAVRAIQAGVDVVLMPTDLDAVVKGVREAVRRGEISETRIDQSQRRILTMKIKRGIVKEEDPVTVEAKLIRAMERIGSREHRQVEAEAAMRSITLVKNNGVLPLALADGQRIAVVGDSYVEVLADAVKKYHAETETIRIGKRGLSPFQWQQVMRADVVILASCTADVKARSPEAAGIELFRQIVERSQRPVIGVGIRNPYDIMAYPHVDAYLAQYGYRQASFAATAATMFGWNLPTGRLPVTIPDGRGGTMYPFGHGLTFEPIESE